MSFNISDNSSTKIHTGKLAPPFKCDDCEFEGLFLKRLKIHKGKQHKIGAEVDGIDDIYIFDLSIITWRCNYRLKEYPGPE